MWHDKKARLARTCHVCASPNSVSGSRARRASTSTETMSKAGAKSAKTDAGKAAKKRPDPEGVKLIEQGDAAMAEKDFAKAIELFTQAQASCAASTVDVVAKDKKPKAPADPAASAEDAAKKEAAKKEALAMV